MIDALLLFVAKRCEVIPSKVSINRGNDASALLCRGEQEVDWVLNVAEQEQNYIVKHFLENNAPAWQLTLAGWQRVEELRVGGADSKECFVAMQFCDEMFEMFQQALSPAIEEAGYEPRCVGVENSPGRIDDAIVAGIRRCRLMVADLTGQRPNVYYEVGFAQGLGKPVILTCRKDELEGNKVGFDIRQYNCVPWSTAEELRKGLHDRIQAWYQLKK